MAPRLASGLLLSIACSAAVVAQPVPPDLYGALIVSSTYRYYASILYGTDAAARRSALTACQEDEPRATCAVYASFRNQCVAVAANGAQHFVALGDKAWDRQRTGDYSLGLCRHQTGSGCRLVLSACSTHAQQLEDQSVRAGPEGVIRADFQVHRAARLVR
ncbi:hypothetical protein LMG26689_00296 [Achromobacter animicus]|uniref:DUF4189 domain-containing protein n=1 Tax=Achromobacter animicus TaxID=1389935 RepID=UPI001467CF46|nr:DUF4189 domain-containing protein [Achromobacter animicus]CAB3817775.1 hypothetical protein LMG26689_00296 [Achromobacter animicus]